MKRVASTILFASLCLAHPANATPTAFWNTLDRDGPLSAGWVQVLPVLSSACNFRVDTGKLSDTLMDLSRSPGNTNYTRDLYNVLYRLDRRQSQNRFVSYWNARFHGDQTAACATAERLWGSAGTQFSGILIREASADGTATIDGARPNNCR